MKILILIIIFSFSGSAQKVFNLKKIPTHYEILVSDSTGLNSVALIPKSGKVLIQGGTLKVIKTCLRLLIESTEENRKLRKQKYYQRKKNYSYEQFKRVSR